MAPVPRINDRGGLPGGPIDRTEHRWADWEKTTDALLMLMQRKGIACVDEHRRAIESLPAEQYETHRYYAKWLAGIETLLVEKGILTRQEIDRRMEGS